VYSISLHYADDTHDDSFGNEFHYKAALNPSTIDGKSKAGRETFDIFFVLDKKQSAEMSAEYAKRKRQSLMAVDLR